MRTCKAALAWAVLSASRACRRRRSYRVEYRRPHVDSRHEHAAAAPSRALAILHAAIYDAVNGSPAHMSLLRHERGAGQRVDGGRRERRGASRLVSLFPHAVDDLRCRSSTDRRRHPTVLRRHPASSGAAWSPTVCWPPARTTVRDAVVPAPVTAHPAAGSRHRRRLLPYVLPHGDLSRRSRSPDRRVRPPGPPTLDSERWCRRLQRGEGARRRDGIRRGPASRHRSRCSGPTVRARTRRPAIGTDRAAMARGARKHAAGERAAVCAAERRDGGRRHLRVGREVRLQLLAAGHGDPERRWRRQPRPTRIRTWSSFIATPPFPDYVSGHSTFSGAAATVLARFYGTDNIAFVTGADRLPGVIGPLPASRLPPQRPPSAVSMAAFTSGRPMRTVAAGMAIGEYAFRHYLQPKGNRSRSEASGRR